MSQESGHQIDLVMLYFRDLYPESTRVTIILSIFVFNII